MDLQFLKPGQDFKRPGEIELLESWKKQHHDVHQTLRYELPSADERP
jgi:hypothetical protein